MAIKVREDVKLEVAYSCPICKEGFLIRDVFSLSLVNKVEGAELFPHQCNKCGHKMHFKNVTYPYIIMQPFTGYRDPTPEEMKKIEKSK